MNKKITVIGGGIVGLASAYALSEKYPDMNVTLLEKEPRVASHQTGHNSGVIHSGVYYRADSLKAQTCRKGRQMLIDFCDKHNLPYEICGKVIIAVKKSELTELNRLAEKAKANGIDFNHVDREGLNRLEPFTSGIEGLHIRDSGIVDYKAVSKKLKELLIGKGHRVVVRKRVVRIFKKDCFYVETGDNDFFKSDYILNCGGLYSDKIAEMCGFRPEVRIIPFRGEYYAVKGTSEKYVKNLIYPVPDPKFPFLGVHLTRMIGGGLECGPNAVPCFAREGYTMFDFNARELKEMLSFPGYLKLCAGNLRMGGEEILRSVFKSKFHQAVRELVPMTEINDLVKMPAGVRAQAVDKNGNLCDDFIIMSRDKQMHILNAPSPAATSSLAIGKHIADNFPL